MDVGGIRSVYISSRSGYPGEVQPAAAVGPVKIQTPELVFETHYKYFIRLSEDEDGKRNHEVKFLRFREGADPDGSRMYDIVEYAIRENFLWESDDEINEILSALKEGKEIIFVYKNDILKVLNTIKERSLELKGLMAIDIAA